MVTVSCTYKNAVQQVPDLRFGCLPTTSKGFGKLCIEFHGLMQNCEGELLYIKKLREDANHKLLTVEMETGICKSKLSKIECGRQSVDFEALYIRCLFYNVSMSMVLMLAENNLGSLAQSKYGIANKTVRNNHIINQEESIN